MRGERLRYLRQARDITQEDLAHMLNTGPKEIWRYENGKTEPSGDTLAKIANFFGVSADYLLGLSDEPLSVSSSDLSASERAVIAAWRHGDKYKAIETIVNDENAHSGA